MTILLSDGNEVSNDLIAAFKKAAINRHRIGVLNRHPESNIEVEAPVDLEFPLIVASFTSEPPQLVFRALEGYQSLAEYHKFGSLICGTLSDS